MPTDDSKELKKSAKAKKDKDVVKKASSAKAKNSSKPKTTVKRTTPMPSAPVKASEPTTKTVQNASEFKSALNKTLTFMFTVAISVIISVILTIITIPFLVGANPLSFYKGDLWKKSNKTIIKASENQSAVSAVAEKVTPSVVTISTYKKQENSFLFPEVEPQEAQPAGTGSGVVYRKDGYIVTNNHVIEGADRVIVTFENSKKYNAKVIAGDPEADIAVIKINKNNLYPIEIGSTKNLSVGDTAVAVGTPFEFQHTVTSGIVSAKNREFEITDYESQTSKTLTNLIQTDAAINPGNSGGALVDESGKLIGINTAIASNSRSSAGIGFAIPIERVEAVANALIRNGRAIYPYIGVHPIDSDKVADKKLPKGIFVQGVVSGGPAEKSGLKSGDVITKINGKNVTSADNFITTIKGLKVGTKIEISYVRESSTINTTVTVAEKPSSLIR